MRVFEKKAIYCIIAAIFSIILAVHFEEFFMSLNRIFLIFLNESC